MVCIYCGHATRVVNSRRQRRGNAIWRRRYCPACGNTFTSLEQPDLSASLVVKPTAGHRMEPFNRDRLFMSLFESCRHRPAALDDAGSLTDTVVRTLLAARPEQGVVSRAAINKACEELLRRFDPVAAAVYRSYHPLSGGDAIS